MVTYGYEFFGLTDEGYCGERVQTKLRLSYDEAWILWAAYQQCPKSCFVSGTICRPHYRRIDAGGDAISMEGMPYKYPRLVSPVRAAAMEIEE